MGTKKQKMFKVNKKHIILASVIGIVIIAAAVCGVLFAAKYNKDVAEEEKRRFEQLDRVALDSDEADMQEGTETDQDESKEDKNKDEEKKKDSDSKENKAKTENKSDSNGAKEKDGSKNNSTKKTISNCVQAGSAPYFVRPTSKECNITVESRKTAQVYLYDLVKDVDMNKVNPLGTISSPGIVYGNYGDQMSGIRVRSGHFSFRGGKPGKTDVIIWKELNKVPLLTMHVTVLEPPEVKLTKIKVTCPSREYVMDFALDNQNTWIDGGSITYEPSNATLKTDSTISIQPNDYIGIRFGSYGDAAYSVQPRAGLQNVSGPITVTVKNGSISGSCTF